MGNAADRAYEEVDDQYRIKREQGLNIMARCVDKGIHILVNLDGSLSLEQTQTKPINWTEVKITMHDIIQTINAECAYCCMTNKADRDKFIATLLKKALHV